MDGNGEGLMLILGAGAVAMALAEANAPAHPSRSMSDRELLRNYRSHRDASRAQADIAFVLVLAAGAWWLTRDDTPALPGIFNAHEREV